MRRAIIATLILAMILAGVAYFVYTNIGEILYDNFTPAPELISAINSREKFDEWYLRSQNGGNRATLWEMLTTFDVECIRKTPQGYYAVMYLDDGSTSYTFFDSNLKVPFSRPSNLIAGEFLTKAETEAALAALEVNGVLTHEKLCDSDMVERFTGIPMNRPRTIGSIVQEGLMLLTFKIGGPNHGVLETVEFLTNLQWYETCNAEIASPTEMPPMGIFFSYILEIDRLAG